MRRTDILTVSNTFLWMGSRRIRPFPRVRQMSARPEWRTNTTPAGIFCRWWCLSWARTWRGPRWGYPLKLQREIDTCNDHHHFFKTEHVNGPTWDLEVSIMPHLCSDSLFLLLLCIKKFKGISLFGSIALESSLCSKATSTVWLRLAHQIWYLYFIQVQNSDILSLLKLKLRASCGTWFYSRGWDTKKMQPKSEVAMAA